MYDKYIKYLNSSAFLFLLRHDLFKIWNEILLHKVDFTIYEFNLDLIASVCIEVMYSHNAYYKIIHDSLMRH